MSRTLFEDIARGREAVAIARNKGMDTTAWEICLAELEQKRLFAWAAKLAEREVVLATPVTFIEAPLRQITTERVSYYAALYLKIVVSARLHKDHVELCRGRWTQEWWTTQENEAIGALRALFNVIENTMKLNDAERLEN